MVQWDLKYNVNEIIRSNDQGENDEDDIKRIASVVIQELEGKPGFMRGKGKRIVRNFRTVTEEDDFNELLNELDDYADETGIWLGL